MRNVPWKRDHRSSFHIEHLITEREARCPFQYKEIFVLILMDMQRRAVAGVRNDLDEQIMCRLYRPPARVSGNVRQVSFATIRPAYCDPGEKLKMPIDSFSLSILISNVAPLAPQVPDLGISQNPILKIPAIHAGQCLVTSLLPARKPQPALR